MWVITFPSVFQALRAEKLLQSQKIPVKLISVPRELSESCEGLAAQLAAEDIERAVALLTEKGVAMIRRGLKIK